MRKIPINLAEPGMILAKPIISETGMQLCSEGTVLTDSIIVRLKKMQITQITLKGDPVGALPAQPPDTESVKELSARFSKIKNDPIMDRLKGAIENALLERNAGEDGGAPSETLA